jgi:homogentisate 1,2-dioxygenase
MHCPFGLYAEQLSGTAFTAPRRYARAACLYCLLIRKIGRLNCLRACRQNQRSWLYRVQPSVVHKPFEKSKLKTKMTADPSKCTATPTQLRWLPFPIGVRSLLNLKTIIYVHGRISVNAHALLVVWKRDAEYRALLFSCMAEYLQPLTITIVRSFFAQTRRKLCSAWYGVSVEDFVS